MGALLAVLDRGIGFFAVMANRDGGYGFKSKAGVF
jgi:hypothetical protein